ncbi:hypothetical protein VUR80DRAFT_1289 [Thermomyces stellatus]
MPDGSVADTTLAADGILVNVNQPPNGLSGAVILRRPNEQVPCLYFCDGGRSVFAPTSSNGGYSLTLRLLTFSKP